VVNPRVGWLVGEVHVKPLTRAGDGAAKMTRADDGAAKTMRP
jgi:hypothetical protein